MNGRRIEVTTIFPRKMHEEKINKELFHSFQGGSFRFVTFPVHPKDETLWIQYATTNKLGKSILQREGKMLLFCIPNHCSQKEAMNNRPRLWFTSVLFPKKQLSVRREWGRKETVRHSSEEGSEQEQRINVSLLSVHVNKTVIIFLILSTVKNQLE